MVRRRSSRFARGGIPAESQRMFPSLRAPEQDLEGGSDSARVSADPVHWGNQRLQTLETLGRVGHFRNTRVRPFERRLAHQSPEFHVSRRRLWYNILTKEGPMELNVDVICNDTGEIFKEGVLLK